MSDEPVDQIRQLMAEAEPVDLPEEMAGAAAATDEAEFEPPPGFDDDQTAVGHNGGPPIDDEPPDDIDPEMCRRGASLPLNDYGNGQRFAIYFGKDVIWVPRVGWFVWNGALWKPDPDLIEVRRRAQKISALIEGEIPFIALSDRQMALVETGMALASDLRAREAEVGEDGKPTPEAQAEIARIEQKLDAINAIKKRLADLRAGHRKFARSSGNTGKISAVVTEAGIGLSRALDDLDANPLEVNTQSGVLRFSVVRADGMSAVANVEMLEHDRAHLLTKCLTTTYDPDADCPLFHIFLERVQPKVEMRKFLQRWFGLSLTGLTGEQKMVFFYGAGANGKSVMVDLMARILGDYGATAKVESLIGKNRRSGGDATPDLIPLVGARFVRASEPEEGERLQEAKIKELTGGEPMLVRGLNADFFEFMPQFKLTMSGNHKPDIRGTDDGIWRRFLLVPWDVQIPPAERDPDMVVKLYDERAGILNWLRDGLLDYLENGLGEPDEVLGATKDYRDESDPVGAMLTEATVVDGADAFITARDLIEAFRFWQYERGESMWGNRTVSNRIKEKADRWKHPHSGRSFSPGKSGVTGYRGIRLTDVFQTRFDKRPQGNRDAQPKDEGGGSWESF